MEKKRNKKKNMKIIKNSCFKPYWAISDVIAESGSSRWIDFSANHILKFDFWWFYDQITVDIFYFFLYFLHFCIKWIQEGGNRGWGTRPRAPNAKNLEGPGANICIDILEIKAHQRWAKYNNYKNKNDKNKIYNKIYNYL